MTFSVQADAAEDIVRLGRRQPRARCAKVDPVLRPQRAQTFESTERFNDQAIPPDRIVL
jgi:hypothetical protein